MGKVVASLDVEVIELDGVYWAYAPWLPDPVQASNANEALTEALMRRCRK